MTFDAGAELLERHFVEWRASPEPDTIQAREESTLDGVLSSQWVTLQLKRMPILYWLGYCCPHC